MPKNLKPVRTKTKAKYDTEVEYIGKQDNGQTGSGEGEPLNESETTGVKEPREGVLGDLPEEIQEYVEKQVAKRKPQKPSPAQEDGEGNGENGEGEPVQLDEQGQPLEQGEESIEDTMANIFDKPLPPELQSKKEALEKAIEDHNARQDAQQQPEGFGDEPDEQGQEEQPAQPEEAQDEPQEEEKLQNETSCTEDERAFLDAFMALQEAGSLLGMAVSTRGVAGTKLRNVRLVPVINEIRESDKLYMTEQQTDGAVFEMMSEQTKKLFSSAEKMLKAKGL